MSIFSVLSRVTMPQFDTLSLSETLGSLSLSDSTNPRTLLPNELWVHIIEFFVRQNDRDTLIVLAATHHYFTVLLIEHFSEIFESMLPFAPAQYRAPIQIRLPQALKVSFAHQFFLTHYRQRIEYLEQLMDSCYFQKIPKYLQKRADKIISTVSEIRPEDDRQYLLRRLQQIEDHWISSVLSMIKYNSSQGILILNHYVTQHNISRIPEHVFRHPKTKNMFNFLHILNISDTLSRTVPRALAFCKITNIDLSHNQLESVPLELLRANELVTLNLSHNHLRVLPACECTIEKLDLRYNQLPTKALHPFLKSLTPSLDITRRTQSTLLSAQPIDEERPDSERSKALTRRMRDFFFK